MSVPHLDRNFKVEFSEDRTELNNMQAITGKKRNYGGKVQLSLAEALSELAVAIIASDDIQVILTKLTSIIGETLRVDHCMLLYVNLAENKIERNSQYQGYQVSEPLAFVEHSLNINIYSEAFFNDQKQRMESHKDKRSKVLDDAGMGEIIHQHLNIQSFFWYPLAVSSNGYYALAFAQIHYQRKLKREEREFLDSAIKIVGIAIQKIKYFTERQQMEETLKKAEKEKDLILSSISEIVILHDKEMKVKWANATAAEYLGVPAEELVGRYCYTMWGNTSFCPDCPIRRALDTGEMAKKQMSVPDGAYWNIKAFPVFDEEGNVIGAVEVSKDITETRKMEKEMARLERLHLIGEMAAGFGHEIRNPMTTVRGFLQILCEKQECQRYDDYFKLMIEEIDRANSIISQFLSLEKYKVITLRENDLNKIIETIYPLILADAIHNDLSIELELTDIPKIYLDKKETHQLILNLVRNGLESMSPGGCLFIKTFLEEGEVVLAVQDQGSGIDEEVINRLGLPFVTTKEEGTGLGLAICYSIVERHHAKIQVKSSSKGTTFYIRYKTGKV